MDKRPFLSIIIPVYNEERRIINLPKIAHCCASLAATTELIVINDGSLDATNTLLKNYSTQFPVTVISYTQNRGKGHALKRGMLAARGKWRLFMDIDVSVPLKTITKVLEIVRSPHPPDILIGTRRTSVARITTHQPKIRELLGEMFTRMSQMWLQSTVTDFTCGFKCFSEKAALDVFEKSQLPRWGFDAETIFIAEKQNLAIQELPVRWKNDPRTKVRFPNDALRSLWELGLVRYFDLRGFYN